MPTVLRDRRLLAGGLLLPPTVAVAVNLRRRHQTPPHEEDRLSFYCIDGREGPARAAGSLRMRPGLRRPVPREEFPPTYPGAAAAVLDEDHQHSVLASLRTAFSVKPVGVVRLRFHLQCAHLRALAEAGRRIYLGPTEDPGPLWSSIDLDDPEELLDLGGLIEDVIRTGLTVPVGLSFISQVDGLGYGWHGLPVARTVATR